MTHYLCVAGGGIGGLAAGVAVSRLHDFEVKIFERTPVFSEVGAGVQLGPNVMRILHKWGLADELNAVAAFPNVLHARSLLKGEILGTLPLAQSGYMQSRYGAPYVTLHRADLHGVLLNAAIRQGVQLQTEALVHGFQRESQGLSLQIKTNGIEQDINADALVIADGVWSELRQQVLKDGPPNFSGETAYRAMLRQSDLPQHLRSQDVTLWLGPQTHVVTYPVRAGEWLNVVCLVHSSHENLQMAVDGACAPLMDLLLSVSDWTHWPLFAREPMKGANELAQGNLALLGDAAHPMLPYLAQGAGMAIEDSDCLGIHLSGLSASRIDVCFSQYAQARWQRNARVQAHAKRNSHIFHATGSLQWGRDASLWLMGARLMDMPWLFGKSETGQIANGFVL